ncbi:MAG: FAD/NAD(P)-binding protein, partial [Desulfobacterota bacterium]|nr:FAD/NAD(P)-binding protein [Thermodesulfobacteriota bacterium]
PYGKGFPFEEAKGKDILFVAGGIGIAPLRPLINQIFSVRDCFQKIIILYGARSPNLLCFREDLNLWAKEKDSKVLLTVDKPDNGWQGNVGVVATLLPQVEIDIEKTIAFVCGPPVMIQFVINDLIKLGLMENNIITSLERRMECGVGKCGHCTVGEAKVCQDGPVFSYQDLTALNLTDRIY